MNSFKKSLAAGFAALWIIGMSGAGHAAITVPNGPLYVGAAVQPLVMLDITKDQNLFHKAYDDYSDLNNDGFLETTYNHTIDYYGYFDSYKCYTYSSGEFVPDAATYAIDADGNPIKPTDCSVPSGKWHGNFLNWVSMSRMDAVRKLLYGGKRSTDNNSVTAPNGKTVLERAFIPTDSHSWAKYYNSVTAKATDMSGASAATLDARYPAISKLTPFALTEDPVAVTSATSNTIGTGAKTFAVAATSGFSYGDQVWIEDAANPGNYMIGAVSCVNTKNILMYDSIAAGASVCAAGEVKVVVETSVGSGSKTNWKIYDWTQTGITFCNATVKVGDINNTTPASPPLMRVAKGNFALWSANERWQCYWREDGRSEDTSPLSPFINNTSAQGNRAALSGIYASSIGPNKTTSSDGRVANGLGSYDYNVRVQACVTGLVGNERCTWYGAYYKPTGLLQYYGESGQLWFGLMTGSYLKNKSGGVLRKAIGKFSNEITADGTFQIPTDLPFPGAIVSTLNAIRMYGYNYSDGTYNKDGNLSTTFCSWGMTTFPDDQGGSPNCLSWGNPMSEIYLESLRYLHGNGLTPTPAFKTDDTTLIPGLTVVNTWPDPLSKANYCAPLNVLAFNSAAPSYDRDQMAGASDINGANAATKTDELATLEGINDKKWFVGNDGAGTTPADLCSAKTVSSLSKVFGICPEGAGTEGSYLMSGLAFFAHTNRIRTDLDTWIDTKDKKSLKVSTYGISLAASTPRITVKVGGKPVTIMPQGRLDNSGFGSGSLVDFKVVCQIPAGATAATVAAITKISAGMCSTAGSGAFYVNVEDSEQGGDYDQDMWGRMKYAVDDLAGTIKVTTDVVAQSTPYKFGFGYGISGTTQDGPHFHSGINGFLFSDLSGTLSCSGAGCNYADAATSATYTAGGAGGGTLNDPLWYAAKYGGFRDTDDSGFPDKVSKWDNMYSDGSTKGCTATGCDGVPDNYFQVTNPNYLENALDKAFTGMLSESSASSVATNSTSLKTDSRIYQASFNSNDWSGHLFAYNVDPTKGDVSKTASWDSGVQINSQTPSNRRIITFGRDKKAGIPFTWAAISSQTDTTQKDALNKNAAGTVDGKGSKRVDYLRGDTSNEGKAAGYFRPRPLSVLGDLVNSSPVYVGAPSAGWAGADYTKFTTKYKDRKQMLYVGSNDGMLHAFDVETGNERLAYVPSVFYNNAPLNSNLSLLTSQTYGHKYFVDGTPMVNDIEVPSALDKWKTVLVGGLNWGGRAYFALDITNPDDPSSDHSVSTNFADGELNAANILMWEFTNSNDGDLGFTVNQPTYPPFKSTAQQIAKMRNGKWAAIVGNGYNSDSGKAAVFIFFLDHTGTTWAIGTDYIKLVADATGPNNGLSTPLPFSVRQDGITDWIYAGDLQGNLWKFDVSSATTSDWKLAFSGKPLFVATDSGGVIRQPITTAPQVMAHPYGGAMVLFGTGKYLETSDTLSPSFKTQSLYGIWDGDKARSSPVPRSSLRQQEVSATTKSRDATEIDKVTLVSTTVTNEFRDTSDYCIGNTPGNATKSGIDFKTDVISIYAACGDNWTATATDPKLGWYIDMPNSVTTGERIAYNPLLRNNRIVAPTLIPSATPCDVGGTSWQFELEALTGRRLAASPFDVNGDDKFDTDDLITFNNKPRPAGAIKPGQGGIITTPTVIKAKDDPKKEFKYSSSSKGAIIKTPESVDQGQAGRISWREITE